MSQTPIEVDASGLHVFDGIVAGSRDAVALAYERFLPLLLRRAEEQIPAHLREKIVADSIVHSAMCSLMDLNERQLAQWRTYHVNNWGGLYCLLVTIVVRKSRNRVREFSTQKKDATRIAPIDPATLLAKGPTPEDDADFDELLRRVWTKLAETEQKILALRMEGRPDDVIADQMDLMPTTVKAVFKKVERVLQRLINEQKGE